MPAVRRTVRVGTVRVGAVTSLLATVALVGAIASCSGNPEIQLSQSGPGGSDPTVTMTVPHWRTVTATVTAEPSTTTATVLATPTVTVTLPPRPPVTSASAFDQGAVTRTLQAIIDDIIALDVGPVSGASAAVRLDSLAARLSTLEAMAAPPGLDPPSWQSRVISLRLFAGAASDEALAGSPQALARYSVIRSETGVLLSMANGALRTNLTLPPAPTLR